MQIHQIYKAFISVVIMFLCTVAVGDEIDDGISAFDNGDYETAHEILLPLAKHHGYANAMNTLGVMYEQGLGVTAQGSEAEKWYKKAALEGNTNAMFNLGVLYAEGNLIPKDLVKGMAWIGTAYDHREKEALKAAKLLSAILTEEQLAEAGRMREQINDQIYGETEDESVTALTEPPVEQSRLLTTEQIIDAYSGKTVSFEFRESIATERYRKHSSREKALKGKKSKLEGEYRSGYYTAKWWVKDDMMCLEFPKVEEFDGCFWVESIGTNEMRTYSQKDGAIGTDRFHVD